MLKRLLYVLFLICAFAGAADAEDAANGFPYEAIFTCGLQGMRTNIAACFLGGSSGSNTQLEIRNGQNYGMYQVWELPRIGRQTPDGFLISLREHFKIEAQNANTSLILTLVIRDRATKKIKYQKSAAWGSVIAVKH